MSVDLDEVRGDVFKLCDHFESSEFVAHFEHLARFVQHFPEATWAFMHTSAIWMFAHIFQDSWTRPLTRMEQRHIAFLQQDRDTDAKGLRGGYVTFSGEKDTGITIYVFLMSSLIKGRILFCCGSNSEVGEAFGNFFSRSSMMPVQFSSTDSLDLNVFSGSSDARG